MSGLVLLVAPGRPGAHATIADALLAAPDGALIRLAPGTYAEELVITAPVTLAAEGGPGRVRVHAAGGSAIVAEAAVCLSGLAVSGEDPGAPVIDVRDGGAQLDGCHVSGRAWAAVLVQDPGTVTLRDCELGNDYGAGIVVTSAGGNLVADTVIRDVASSAVVVAGDGMLTLLRARLERPRGNGIIVNGQARVIAEDTSITGAVKPAVAVEEEAGADLARLAVTTDTGPGAYLAGRGPIVLARCSFRVRDAGQPAVLVAGGTAARGEDLTVAGGAAGIRVDDGAELTLTGSVVRADGDGIQVRDGGALTATHCRIAGADGLGLNVAPAGRADMTSCTIDVEAEGTPADAAGDRSDESGPGERAEVAPAGPAAEPAESTAVTAGESAPSLPSAATGSGGPEPSPPELARPGPEVPEDAARGPAAPELAGSGLVLPELELPEPAPSPYAAPAAGESATDPAADLKFSLNVQLIGDLAGLGSVRRAVPGLLVDLIRLRASGQPVGAQANLAFAGHDGSGRRAVAELYARALAELGFLRTGAVDWAPLTDFPARRPEQAGRYADWLLSRSHGGLLLLEADDIFAQWPAGQRAGVLTALPGAVHGFPDAVIVLSGEPGLLTAALADDPALAECFPTRVRFAPYTPAELAELTIRRLAVRGCRIGDGVRAALTGYFRPAGPSAVGGDAIGAWDAHRLAAYLDDVAPGPEVTPADVLSAMHGEHGDRPAQHADGPVPIAR